eukprot:3970753-Lingulodinium_polyedra.AAC.1
MSASRCSCQVLPWRRSSPLGHCAPWLQRWIAAGTARCSRTWPFGPRSVSYHCAPISPACPLTAS